MANTTRSGSGVPKWNKKSVKHEAKFQKLLDSETNVTKIGPVRVCFDKEFRLPRIRAVANVYLGLHDDGSEVSVKKIVTNNEDLKETDELKILPLPNVRNSDNIVKYRGHVCKDNITYIIFDLCEETLEEFVQRHPPSYLVRHCPVLIKEILSGLDALHNGEEEVIHMDLNPWNILVDIEGHARLACFSLSTILNQDQSTLETHPIRDLNIWLAPESIKPNENGKVVFTKKSDVHVVGMICFYVLAECQHVFGLHHERARNIIDGKPVSIEKLENPEAKRFVSWLISHDSKDRPSAREALADPYLQTDTTTAAGDLCELEPMKKKGRHEEDGNNNHQPSEGINTTAEIHDVGEGSSSIRNWKKTSIVHREKFEKLIKIMNSEPDKVTEINGVSVCFEDEFFIGNGCLGTKVYIGLCQDGTEKAVKRLPSQLCKSLGSNERSILTSQVAVESPRIVNYWFYDDTSNPQFYHLILNLYEITLKKYVDEQNLEDLKKNAPKMMRQILEGLETLHSRQPRILHRDLKPSNILVNVKEDLLLADFGISKILPDNESSCWSAQRGPDDWKAVESIASDDEVEVKYKRKSDIQVAGMLGFYILTEGEYVYGPKFDRLHNQYHDNPVGLNNLDDPVAKDLIAWMLKHEICDRPYAEEALKHPYLQPLEKQSEMICSVGNEPEIKQGDVTSEVVQEINAHPLLENLEWKSRLPSRVLQYADSQRRRPYGDPWTDCLRFIRNQIQHSNEHPADIQQIVGEARVYFMKTFPLLPVVVHQTIRCYPDWKTRPELKKFFA